MRAEGHLPEVLTPDPCTVTTFASRQLLELVAAVLHVPSLHAAHLTATATLPAQTKGPQVEAAFLQPLLTGLQHSVLSCWISLNAATLNFTVVSLCENMRFALPCTTGRVSSVMLW